MAQVMIKAQFSYSIESEDLFEWDMAAKNSARSEVMSTEWLRENRSGPDYDPNYSEKLEAYFQEEFGGLGEFEPIVS